MTVWSGRTKPIALDGAKSWACRRVSAGIRLAMAPAAATLCPASATTADIVPSCGARTTIRCRAAFSADCCATTARSRSISPWAARAAQRQLPALGLQRGDLAQVGGALPLERDQLRLDAEQLLGLGAHLGVGDVVVGAERLVLRQRLLGELLALALQGLFLGERAELALHRLDPTVEGGEAGGLELAPAGPSCRAGSAGGRPGSTRRRPGCRRRCWTGRPPARTGRRPAAPAGPLGRALRRPSPPGARPGG